MPHRPRTPNEPTSRATKAHTPQRPRRACHSRLSLSPWTGPTARLSGAHDDPRGGRLAERWRRRQGDGHLLQRCTRRRLCAASGIVLALSPHLRTTLRTTVTSLLCRSWHRARTASTPSAPP
eukprot:scaffold123905_cov51-Phaeocystis_antarctica.AAC.2